MRDEKGNDPKTGKFGENGSFSSFSPYMGDEVKSGMVQYTMGQHFHANFCHDWPNGAGTGASKFQISAKILFFPAVVCLTR